MNIEGIEMVDIYFYHPETKEWIFTTKSSRDYFEQLLKEGKHVTIAPIKSHWEFESNVYNEENSEWEIKKDYRSFYFDKDGRVNRNKDNFIGFYLPLEGDTPDSPRRFMHDFGDLPIGQVEHLSSLEYLKKFMLTKLKEAAVYRLAKIFPTEVVDSPIFLPMILMTLNQAVRKDINSLCLVKQIFEIDTTSIHNHIEEAEYLEDIAGQILSEIGGIFSQYFVLVDVVKKSEDYTQVYKWVNDSKSREELFTSHLY